MLQKLNKAVSLHKKLKGKIYVGSKIQPLKISDLKLIYTPGVADVCMEISKKPNLIYQLTSKGNNVAIVTDGTRILGLGNIGPEAALPVMEGKSVLYHQYGGVNAFPICLNTTNKKEIMKTIEAIEPVFGAINLEDIESPKVLDISYELEKKLKIPIFHDDRHGTAVVALAALLNSMVVVGKKINNVKVVIAGAGSAGYCIGQLIHHAGCKNIVVVDSSGAIYKGRKKNMNKYKKEIAKFTNSREKGNLEDVLKNSDIFIGVSGKKNILNKKMILSMAKDPIVFALTNPYPEIDPRKATKFGAKIIGTGSYNYSNQVNNALVFPYLMRSILDLKIQKITMDLLYTTSLAIANSVPQNMISENNILPKLGNPKLQNAITNSLSKLVRKS